MYIGPYTRLVLIYTACAHIHGLCSYNPDAIAYSTTLSQYPIKIREIGVIPDGNYE